MTLSVIAAGFGVATVQDLFVGGDGVYGFRAGNGEGSGLCGEHEISSTAISRRNRSLGNISIESLKCDL